MSKSKLTDYEAVSLSLLAHLVQGIDALGQIALAAASKDGDLMAKQAAATCGRVENVAPLIDAVRKMVTERTNTD